MRILIYKEDHGFFRRLVLPAKRAHLSPVLIQGSNKQQVAESLENAIAFVSGAETIERQPRLPE